MSIFTVEGYSGKHKLIPMLTTFLLVSQTGLSPISNMRPPILENMILPLTNQSESSNVNLVSRFGGDIRAIAVQDECAYLGQGSRLIIIDISNPDQPYKLGETNNLHNIIMDIAVVGNYAYVTQQEPNSNETGGLLSVVNVENPFSPGEVGFYYTGGGGREIIINGHYAYVADYEKGLRIIDVENPNNPNEVGFYDTPGLALGVAIAGDYAYVADADGLRIFNVANPNNPIEINFFPLDYTNNVKVEGNFAYVLYYSGMRIFNITNPSAPIDVGLTLGGDELSIRDGYVYLTTLGSGYSFVNIIDISNPFTPKWVGHFGGPGQPKISQRW